MRTGIFVLKKVYFLFIIFLGISFSGCVVTRSQLSPGAQNQKTKYNTPGRPINRKKSEALELQQKVAQLEVKMKTYDEQFRILLGRIESAESKSSNTISEDRVKDLEQALSEMLVQQDLLKKQIQTGANMVGSSDSRSTAAPVKGDLETADKLFSTGKWSDAVQEFQKYREKNPKSDELPLVTYKIGVCFQELGMKNEARTFYNNVISKFSSSKAAKFAKFRLDNMN